MQQHAIKEALADVERQQEAAERRERQRLQASMPVTAVALLTRTCFPQQNRVINHGLPARLIAFLFDIITFTLFKLQGHVKTGSVKEAHAAWPGCSTHSWQWQWCEALYYYDWPHCG